MTLEAHLGLVEKCLTLEEEHGGVGQASGYQPLMESRPGGSSGAPESKGFLQATDIVGGSASSPNSEALSSVENWLHREAEEEVVSSGSSPPSKSFAAGIGQQIQNFVDESLTAAGGPVRHHLAMDSAHPHTSIQPGTQISSHPDAHVAPADAKSSINQAGGRGASQNRIGCSGGLGTAVASAIGRGSSASGRPRGQQVATVNASTSAEGGGVGEGPMSPVEFVSKISGLITWPLRIISRLRTTLRGSSADIGWLKREPGLPPVVDGTERFVKHVARVLNGVHTLPDSLVYLLVPGMFSNMGSLYFASTKKHLNKLGLTCDIAKIHSEAAVETNASELVGMIEELHWGSGGKRVMVLGHSKGGVDTAAAFSLYWDRLQDKVAGLVLVQSPYGGTPVASDLLRKGQLGETESRTLTELIISRLFRGDLRSMEDITYEQRRQFLTEHPLPPGIPMVSFHTEAPKDLAVLTELSHIHVAQVPVPPSLSSQLSSQRDMLPSAVIPALEAAIEAGAAILPVTLPASALLATLAWKLELRYGAKSDGLVTRDDAEVPGSIVVRPQRKMDHAWPVYASARKETGDNITAPQLCEALITLLLEEWPLTRDHGDPQQTSDAPPPRLEPAPQQSVESLLPGLQALAMQQSSDDDSTGDRVKESLDDSSGRRSTVPPPRCGT